MPPRFVHLRLHSEYSIVDGIVRIKSLLSQAQASGMVALGLTDESNLFGAVKFYKAAIQSGIKPIIGADVWWRLCADSEAIHRFTLLCQNLEGYRNLSQLISLASLHGQIKDKSVLLWSDLEKHHEGLIALSGAMEGEIGRALFASTPDAADQCLKRSVALFGDRFYLEVQRIGKKDEEYYLERVVALADRHRVPLVATNNVHFLYADDYMAHEARVCIHRGEVLRDKKRVSHYTPQQYLRTEADMLALFSDLPSALANSVEIAKRCNLQIELGKSYLPQFPVPSAMTTDSFLISQAREKLEIFLSKHSELDRERYVSRLEVELDVIVKMGFAGYFLIVADFIRWAKENQIAVGPGRGSGAGSLVAFALGITDIDPLPYDLLFERFLNPERISMPDFDIDFCMEGRDRVIDYVTQFYGRESVSQIITFGSMAAKAVVRDVGRVMGYPYGFVDTIAKLIPFELGITLDKALDQDEVLRQRYNEDDDVKALIDLARSLEGITRNAGKHAGGVVIAPTALTDFTPLYRETGGDGVVTQFDKDDVEAVGLVKFDFLGLRTLTIIDWTLAIVNETHKQNGQATIDITNIPLEDPPTYDLLKSCQTTAVFQLESRGMKDLVRRLQPDCFEDIVALVALYRPGPLQSGMVDDFINRKHGRAPVDYMHPDLEPVLRPTYGVILYQEQVMQIAQVLAGYSLGEADLLRRAMGKKKPEEMAKQREKFLEGAQARGVGEGLANTIFDLMEKFAGYGFNKSHSAAYALLSYQTAWLKTHYPAAFMAAVLSSDMDHTDKVVGFLHECRQMKLSVLPPHVNYSDYRFVVEGERRIRYGLGAVKGVGQAAIEYLVQVRKTHGLFKHLFDFCERAATRKMNRRMLEALIRAGALDDLGAHRAAMMASLENALKHADKKASEESLGQHDLFADLMPSSETPCFWQECDPWDEMQMLQGEKETLGTFLSGHPLNFYIEELKSLDLISIHSLIKHQGHTLRIAGILSQIRTKVTKRGDKIAFAVLEDQSGQIEISVFSEAFREYREELENGALVIASVEVHPDEFSGGIRVQVQHLHRLERFRERYAKFLSIHLDALFIEKNPQSLHKLQELLEVYGGGPCPVRVEYRNSNARASFVLPQARSVYLQSEFLEQLQSCFGKQAVHCVF